MKGENEHLPLLRSAEQASPVSFDKATLAWSNVCAESSKFSLFSQLSSTLRASSKQKEKSQFILNGLSGIARPGEVLAIMGTSGVGKTTLMKILSGSYGDHLQLARGNVYLNGYLTTETQRQKGSYIGYVEQQETFIDTMTIEEHLIFEAMLRMSDSLSDDERRLRVKNIINKLHLTKSMNNTINKLSGGEKKRLALANAFLLEPPVILIDEPTSSLDAYLAISIMRIIRSMAVEKNRTIITVIHQPTSAMFDLLDKVYVIVEGGRQAFYGSKDQAVDFFTNQCKLESSSLDGFIEQLAAPPGMVTKENLNVQQTVADEYVKSEHAKSLEMDIDNHIQSHDESDLKNRLYENGHSGFLRQLKWLLWRSFISDLRNPVRTTFLLVRVIIPAILYGILYFQLCGSNAFIQNVSAINLAVVSLTVNTSAYMILGTMTTNNHMGIKENRQGIYGIFAYYLSIVIHDLPTLFLFPFIANTFIYWMSGMDNTWSHYFSFVGVTILASNMGAAFGQLFSAFSNSVESVIGTAVPVLQTLSIYSGFYFNSAQIPHVLNAISYISPYYYSYTTLSTLQWTPHGHGETEECYNSKKFLQSDKSRRQYTYSGYIDLCRHILSHIGIRDLFHNVLISVFIMFMIIFICHFIALCAIWLRAHRAQIIEYWTRRRKNSNGYNQM